MTDTVYLERSGERLVLAAGPRDKALVDKIPGRRWDRQAGMWDLPLGWMACVVARDVFGARLELGPEVIAWGFAEKSRLDGLEALKHLPWDTGRYGFQHPSVEWKMQAGQALDTDDVGLGKMITTLKALCNMAARGENIWPVLIVCPNSVKRKWEAEWETWGPTHGGIVVVGGTLAQKRKQFAADASVWVIHWEALRLHSRLAPYGSTRLTDEESREKELDEIGFRTVIADEAHRGSDPGSKQTRAWWNVSHKATYRSALTATPVRNRPDDLWAIMHSLRPDDFPRKSAFIDRYCHAGVNMHGGFEVYGLRAEMKPELFSFLDPHMIRRTKEDIGLVPPFEEDRLVDMDGKQEKAYKALEAEMMTEVDGEYLLADSPLTLHGRLTQLAGATPVLGDVQRKNRETGETETVTGVVSLTTPSCKVDALMDLIDEVQGAPLVVFAESRKLIDLCGRTLEKHKIPHVMLVGGLTSAVISQREAMFQEGEAQVALCVYSAVAEGINLGRAQILVRLQRSRSMVQNTQAVGRIDGLRRSAETINIINYVTRGTVEEDVKTGDDLKLGHLEEVLRDRARKAQPVSRATRGKK